MAMPRMFGQVHLSLQNTAKGKLNGPAETSLTLPMPHDIIRCWLSCLMSDKMLLNTENIELGGLSHGREDRCYF